MFGEVKMKILFICKYNRLRSKIAEALFTHYNEDKKHEVRSAGIRSYFLSPYIMEKAKKLLEQRGIKVDQDASVMVNDYLIKWADKIIIVANDVDPKTFPKDKTIVWDVHDLDDEETESIVMRIDIIDKKINELIKELGENR
jgi:protein-tyrosine-phosphatase